MVGVITRLGQDIPGGFQIGDYIGMAPAIGCGECSACKKGHTNMCDRLATMGFQYDGGFAEYAVIPRHAFEMGNVYKLPEAEDRVIFALSEPLACVINAQSYLKINPGEQMVIFGSGIIGCMHAELALIAGASVFIVEASEERLGQVRDILPGVQFIKGEKNGSAGEIIRHTGGKGADVAVVACSAGEAQADGLNSLAKCGRISLFGGLPNKSIGFLDSNIIHYNELGVFGVHASTPEQNKSAMDLIHSGKINVKKYISKRYPFRDIENAFREAANGNVLKAVVCMGDA
jgi:L-iditol 2-dehydrogenase